MSDSVVPPPAQPPVKLETPQQFREFIDQFDTFLFDCDGVLWSGSQQIPHVGEVLNYLRDLGKSLIFVTNNSTASRQSYVPKFEKLGLSVDPSEVFPSSYSAACYISTVLQIPTGSKLFVIGESGITSELTDLGYIVLGGDNEEDRRAWHDEEYDAIVPDGDVKAVVVGLDRHINYAKLARGYHHLQVPGCHFIATNTDATYPSSRKLFPGAGSILAPLELMVGRKAVSCGKPHPAMMDAIEGVRGVDRARTCMVGDRLDTDVKFGVDSGLGGTLAVLTGVVKEEEIVSGRFGVWSKYYAESLGELIKAKQQ
ncbi:4-nitrophenylphosphatase [Ascobolus immersus RN42]|uniref:4-nitrophenylphosphatase n=1 Tax=Ascobolus immersus RN42 TaxID=1160509 RepID=A0A3N4HR83_ASCIM|nr:4-nitrophenylphosphatase [Ascobolus immersus RN42]